MVCANIVYEKSGRPFLSPLVIKFVKGVPIAFIGANTKATPSIVTKSGIEGLKFIDEAQAINKYVKILKRWGIRTIVAVIHEGASQWSYSGPTDETKDQPTGSLIDIVNKLDDEVDVVIGGHTHGFCNALVPNENGKKILVTQAWSEGSAYSDIDLVIDRRSRNVTKMEAEIITTWADSGAGLTPDQDVAALVEQANTLVGPITEKVITTAAFDITKTQNNAGESALGNLIADAQRSITGTDFAFMNPGGIRDSMYAGDVTWGQLYTIQPFNNYLMTMELSGQQIYDLLNQQWYNQPYPRVLQISGLSYTWDKNRPQNDAIIEVRDSSGPIDKTATYSITVNSFIAEGGDNFSVLLDGTNRVTGMIDLDALIIYLESFTEPVNAAIEGRITVIE
jgi:5'-nucleotidase